MWAVAAIALACALLSLRGQTQDAALARLLFGGWYLFLQRRRDQNHWGNGRYAPALKGVKQGWPLKGHRNFLSHYTRCHQ